MFPIVADTGAFAPQEAIQTEVVLNSESVSPDTGFNFPTSFQLRRDIVTNRARFLLREPVEVDVSWENGLWIYGAPPLGIEAFGTSMRRAEASFFEDFAVLYREIAQEADERLTPEAIAVKRAFLSAVIEVQMRP